MPPGSRRRGRSRSSPQQNQIRPSEILSPIRRRWLPVAVLVAVTFAVYYPAINHPFVNYDDPDYVTENRHVQQGLSLATLQWALSSTEQANWHPLTWLSHAFDCDLFGLDAAGHHFTSILFHALNAAILFLILEQASGFPWRSLLVAAIFALHPLNVECVAWVAERKSVLSMFFFLLAFAAYGWYAKAPNLKRYSAVFLLSLMALASKPMVVTIPFVLLLLDFWPLQRVRTGTAPTNEMGLPRYSWRALAVEKLPFLALAIASCVITIVAQKRAIKTTAAVPFGQRLINAAFSYCAYLWKAVWPLHLGVFYAPRGATLSALQAGLCLAFLVTVSALVWKARSRKYLVVGWLWYLGTLVPMIGLVQAGEQGMADRYAYLPLIGIFVACVWAMADLAAMANIGSSFIAGAAAAVLFAFALLGRRQLQTWESSFSLWTHSLEVTSENYVAEDFVGAALLNEAFNTTGQSCSDEALQHFERAVSINPQDSLGHLDVGFCNQSRGHLQKALEEYKTALQYAPNKYLRARAYLNLGAVYDSLGDFKSSRESYEQGLKVHPADQQIRAGLTHLDADEQLAELSNSAQSRPTAAAYLQLGTLQQKLGYSQDARASFQKALSLDPRSVTARNALESLGGGR